MFRFFENLVDPYTPYVETDTPPRKLWPFMRAYCEPFKGIFVLTAIMSIVVAEPWYRTDAGCRIRADRAASVSGI